MESKGYYAGVGSRKTPPSILALMEKIGQVLSGLGHTLLSGGGLLVQIKPSALAGGTSFGIYIARRYDIKVLNLFNAGTVNSVKKRLGIV